MTREEAVAELSAELKYDHVTNTFNRNGDEWLTILVDERIARREAEARAEKAEAKWIEVSEVWSRCFRESPDAMFARIRQQALEEAAKAIEDMNFTLAEIIRSLKGKP